MSKKTSTAALASFRHGPLPNQRRAPRHPHAKRTKSASRSRQENSGTHHQFQQAQLMIRKEDTMNANTSKLQRRSFVTILPVILRITCSLLLWTVGASAMDLRLAQVQPKEHRVTINFPPDRANLEELQRWVNAGHDPWCLDPQLVAAAALRRVSPQFAEYEFASLPLEREHGLKNTAVYTFHSFDGRTTYRVTLQRHLYLLDAAGSIDRIIWTPEKAEIVTHDTRD
jgi:hypothetical protein